MRQGLAQLVLAPDTFNKVSLVDDVNQVDKLCNTPENLANTQTQFPGVTNQEEIQLAYVKMGALRISTVDSQKKG